MKKLLVMMTVLAMCATSAFCAEVTPKKGPSAKAYEQASDKSSFKRTVESKEKTIKKDVKAQGKSVKTESKGKKKGFLWW